MTPEQIANLREIHAQAVTNRGGDFEVECDEAARLAFMADAPRLLDIAERFARLRDALAIKTAMLDEAPKNMAKIARIAAILEPLRALEAAATPGPWWREWSNADDHEDGIDILACGHGGRVALVEDSEIPGTRETGFGPAAIADMICAARNALPALLREIQETP